MYLKDTLCSSIITKIFAADFLSEKGCHQFLHYETWSLLLSFTHYRLNFTKHFYLCVKAIKDFESSSFTCFTFIDFIEGRQKQS